MTKQKPPRRAQIIQLSRGDSFYLRISRRIEPRILAIQHKHLARRIAIAPTHLSRFAQQQSATLLPVNAHTVKTLGKSSPQRMKAVVVLVHPLRQLLCGIGAPPSSWKEQK